MIAETVEGDVLRERYIGKLRLEQLQQRRTAPADGIVLPGQERGQ